MVEQVPSAAGAKSWRNWLALPLAPFTPLILVLLIPVFVGFYIASEAHRRSRARRLRLAMSKAGRTATWAIVESELASGAGTLILDSPCTDWNDLDVWWTNESVLNLAAKEGILVLTSDLGQVDQAEFDARMKAPVFDRWCNARFFDASRGTAKLVQCTHWQSDLSKIRKQIDKLKLSHSRLESVDTNSWMVSWADEAQRQSKGLNAGGEDGSEK